MKLGIVVAILVCAGCVCGAPGQLSNSKQQTRTNRKPHHARKARHGHLASGQVGATRQEKLFVNQGPMAPSPEPPTVEAVHLRPEAVEPRPEPVVVTYSSGALGITARDVSLQEVLQKVQEATGAPVDAPSVDKHISVQVAAQAPAGAMRELLDGTQLDYAMLGGTNMNDPVRRIIIAPRMAPRRGNVAPVQTVENTEVQERTPAMIRSEQTGGDEGVLEPPAAATPGANPARRH